MNLSMDEIERQAKHFRNIWTTEKADWVIYAVHDNKKFIRYAIFKPNDSLEITLINSEYHPIFIQFLIAKGLPIYAIDIDDLYT